MQWRVSVDEVSLAEPGQRGCTFRTFDPTDGQWSIYWITDVTADCCLR